MKTIELHLESTFARTKEEANNKLKAIANCPEVKERINEISIKPSSIGFAYKGGVSCVLPRKRKAELAQSIDGFSACLLEQD